ncbi:serine-rich adhesin for platelets isoform X1 [Musca domestica]|uniref:Serine-rich adhesin for platelets isoform X1 n=1 Tax=Musca domestica TaxID=7370 RepID=A0A9J7D3J8_MUSDO|nr:serine-rich adhesin for platelets isoform X1 [Musca domestica]
MLQEENNEEYQKERFLYILLMTVNVSITLVIMLAACLCCKKKLPKNDLLGLEGMVKLKNPDEVVVVTQLNASESHVDLNNSTVSQADSEKRASTAAHRSLPDIPVAEANGDTGSELYETVADKMLMDAQNQNKSPTPSLKKQISVSQHSSISQADDVSSPYSRVKNSPHDYAKVRPTEHPYAQLNAPSTSHLASSAPSSNSIVDGAQSQQHHHHHTSGTQLNVSNNESIHQQRTSHHSDNAEHANDNGQHEAEIPAASAIAGMISASQDLPYMTPPIANQHFSGDSQDSSKGYTSISVREPLANILAQQPQVQSATRSAGHSRDVNDSHYATVSDDSDETYAAIEDPNNRPQTNVATDIYTSGSETYAQIQPMQSPNSMVVSVEINNTNASTVQLPASSSGHLLATGQQNLSSLSSHSTSDHHNASFSSQHSTNTCVNVGAMRSSLELITNTTTATPIPPPVDSLRAQMHSRQASASSNNSTSLCNLGSPKPEKRQANSPLPPTPKSNVSSSTTQLQALSSSNLTSGRNSVISVIECAGELMEEGVTDVPLDSSPQRRNKSLSPSKDIEGMYAKVMKKNKFSRNSPSSQNSSPILQRKYNTDDSASALGVSPLDKLESNNSYGVNTINDRRLRSNSYGASKDHGYETIPADAMRGNSTQGIIENRKSDGYAHVLQKERQRENVHTSSSVPPINVYSVQLNNSDKHYETIAQPPNAASSNDPGYETLEKPKNLHHHQQQLLQDDCEKKSSDYDPNYEVLKGPTNSAGASDDGYAKVLEKKNVLVDGEDSLDGYSKVRGETETAAGYSTIADVKRTDANHNYASILETKREAIGGGGGNSDDNQLETDSDHYARIAEKNIAAGEQATTIRTPPNLPLSASQKSMVDEELLTPRTTTELSITSPTSITSSSMLNTTSSINSTSTNLTTTSTISSRQTPTSSSQYESLTGSETDPNYESVCYLNTSGQEGEENPYERLHTEISDDITQLSSPEASTHTAGATTTTTTTNSSSSSSSNSSAAAAAAMAEQHSKMLKANGSKVTITNQDNTANDILVNDYFQV